MSISEEHELAIKKLELLLDHQSVLVELLMTRIANQDERIDKLLTQNLNYIDIIASDKIVKRLKPDKGTDE